MSEFSFFESLEARICFRVEGVDVSVYQGAINWNTLAANNKQFAFVRASRTNLDLDPNLAANMSGAKAAGVLTGVYHRILPKGESEGGVYTDPITDAHRFVDAGGKYMGNGYLRPVIDAEDGYTLGKAALSKWVNDFSDEVTKLTGVVPIVYCSTNYATNYLDTSVSSTHDLWLARWNDGNSGNVNPQTDQPQTPSGYPNSFGSWNEPIGGAPSNSSWDFWQYTSNGNGPALGVSSARLDLDVFNGNMDELKRGFLTGYQYNFKGTPYEVGPGGSTTIQAEDYDFGGEGVAFHDTNAVNTGGVYRTGPRDGVDLKLISGTSNAYRIGDAYPGEWTEYTIDVTQAGTYNLIFRVSQSDPNAKIHGEIDGTNITGSITVPDTNSFSTFTNVTKAVSLSAGKHVFRLAFDAVAKNGTVAGVDYLRFEPKTTTTTKTITTSTAAYVRGGTYANQNYGNSSELVVKTSPASSSNTRETYLKFELSSVTTITSAKLVLYGKLSGTTNSSVGINVFNATNTSWAEGSITNANKPASGDAVRGSTTITGTSNKNYEIDLTAFLQAEKAAGRNVVTLVLKAKSPTDVQAVFASDETANGPKLIIA